MDILGVGAILRCVNTIGECYWQAPDQRFYCAVTSAHPFSTPDHDRVDATVRWLGARLPFLFDGRVAERIERILFRPMGAGWLGVRAADPLGTKATAFGTFGRGGTFSTSAAGLARQTHQLVFVVPDPIEMLALLARESEAKHVT